MAADVIFYGPGPLPASGSFSIPTDGPATLVLSGTTTTQGSAPCLTGITLQIDGTTYGEPATCWANNNNNHTAMMPIYIPVQLSYGEHQFEINTLNGETQTDVNDVFQLVLLY